MDGTCCCDRCLDENDVLRSIERDRLDGRTLEEIGEDLALTRERVRQILKRLWGGSMAPLDAVKRSVDVELRDIERIRQVGQSRPCVACGHQIAGGSSRRAHCSQLCADVANALRYHVDDERRERHREIVQRYHRLRRGAGESRRGARNGARYIQPGSAVWHAAMLAVRNGWAIADRLPEEIVERDLMPYLEDDHG